jgi:gentisate 1,2-dioxygenase
MEAYLWRWSDLRPLMLRAGDLVDLEHGAERRVLVLLNPGLPGRYGTTHTLVAAIQLIKPGEIAPTHRHTPAAIRLIIEGEGAYTTVDGEKCLMQVGDLILTPSMTWHDHGNETEGPMIWLDGLDVPFVRSLETIFLDPYPHERQPVEKPVDYSLRKYRAGHLRPSWDRPRGASAPLLTYRWTETASALRHLAEVETSPYDGAMVEYVNPHTGGYTLPTIGCAAQLLPAGWRGQAHRHTASAIYHVVSGRGSTVIDGRRFDWAQGDCFAVPPWSWHAHAADPDADAYLFVLHDEPILAPFGLLRDEAQPAAGA